MSIEEECDHTRFEEDDHISFEEDEDTRRGFEEKDLLYHNHVHCLVVPELD